MIAKKQGNQIRVRMAPSPTGNFHIGSARTALFNWLFVRKEKGVFILRIEDTDKERSKVEFEEDIIDSLAWLGFDFDEGPIRQSERGDVYSPYIQKLLDENYAYYCFCSVEDLEQMRTSNRSAGIPPMYSGKCRSLSASQVKEKHDLGERSVIRFKVPNTEIKFRDLIRGEIKFEGKLIGDFVIGKDIQTPLYNFVVVVDDIEMNITHVIRGDDHINNTPKQLLIFSALKAEPPKFAHLPIILSTTGKGKMSKRDGGTAVADYIREGYLPEAMVNFLALMGFHPKGDEEMVSVDKLLEDFTLSRVQKGGARFDLDKLNWLNSQYLRRKEDKELYNLIVPKFIDKDWINQGEEKILAVIGLLKGRIVKLSDFQVQGGLFFELPPYNPKLLIWKKSDALTAETNLGKCRDIFSLKDDFNIINEKIVELAEELGRGDVFWPLRVAISGLEKSPPPMEIASIIGKEDVIERINEAIDKISALTHPDSFSK